MPVPFDWSGVVALVAAALLAGAALAVLVAAVRPH
jgi:hypothetical protein